MSTPLVMAPLDGSPAAEAALPWAVHLARRAGGEVRLVGVHAPPAVLLDGETLVGSVVPDDAVRQRETDYFADLTARLSAAGVPVTADLLEGGVISSLAEYARQLKPAWVVMLSHARGPLARFFVGETAHEFVRESPCPVLLVHPADGTPDPTAAPAVRRVVVGLDGSPLAERMLGPAAALARTVGAELVLLTVGKGHADYLDRQAGQVRAGGLAVRVSVVPEGDPTDVLVREGDSSPGTVVALATHGRSGFSQMVWGSVADGVVRRTKAPVMAFKPSEP